MFKNETKFGQFIQELCQEKGYIDFKTHGHALQKSGWPDLEILMFRGKSMYLELKVHGNEASEKQKDILDKMVFRGHHAGVLRCFLSDEDLSRNMINNGAEYISLEDGHGERIMVWPLTYVRGVRGAFLEEVWVKLRKLISGYSIAAINDDRTFRDDVKRYFGQK